MKKILVFLVFLSLGQPSLANPELAGVWEQMSFACMNGRTPISIFPFDERGRATISFTSSGSTSGSGSYTYTRLAVGDYLERQKEHVRNCDEDTGVFTPTECEGHRSKLAEMEETGEYCSTTSNATYVTSGGSLVVTTTGETGNCGSTSEAPGTIYAFNYFIESGRLYLSAPGEDLDVDFECTGTPTAVLVKM